MSTANVGALDAIIGQCQRFRQPDVKPLMRQWRTIIAEDTHRGIDEGTDGFGRRMPAVTYRPKGEARAWRHGDQKKHLAGASHIRGGDVRETAHNNLSPAQYRRLTGPPLAPRGRNSRVHTNFYTGDGFDSSRGVFYAVGAWADIVSRKGVPFLMAHFTGANTGRTKLPVRDLRGIRPWGQGECLTALENWGVAHVKATFI